MMFVGGVVSVLNRKPTGLEFFVPARTPMCKAANGGKLLELCTKSVVFFGLDRSVFLSSRIFYLFTIPIPTENSVGT